MNNKGFTMVELLVAMAILALLTVMAFPTLRSVQAVNSNKKIIAYGDSLVSSAKLYTDSYKDDMFNESSTDTYILSFEDLYRKNLVKDINVSNTTCKNSSVIVAKNGDNYLYCLNLICDNKDGEVEIDKDKLNKNKDCDQYKTYKISYYSNYSSNSSLKNKNVNEKVKRVYPMKGSTVKIEKNISDFSINGYEFVGWFKDKNTSNYYGYEDYVVEDDLNLYGLWCNSCKNTSYCSHDFDSTHSCTYKINCPVGYRKVDKDGNDVTSGSNKYNYSCSVNTYNIKYSNEGSVKKPSNAEFNKVVEIPNDKKSINVIYDSSKVNVLIDGKTNFNKSYSYTFDGWTSSNLDKDYAVANEKKWDGTLTKSTKFKSLKLKNLENVTLKANWTNPTITLPTLKKTGYNCHWESDKDIYASGTSFKPKGETTKSFTAKCSPKKINVSFDSNGGSLCSTKDVTYDSKYGTLCSTSKALYTFDGWYTDLNGGDKITKDSIVKISNNHTLYAHWKPKNPPVVNIVESLGPSHTDSNNVTCYDYVSLKVECSSPYGISAKGIIDNNNDWKPETVTMSGAGRDRFATATCVDNNGVSVSKDSSHYRVCKCISYNRCASAGCANYSDWKFVDRSITLSTCKSRCAATSNPCECIPNGYSGNAQDRRIKTCNTYNRGSSCGCQSYGY